MTVEFIRGLCAPYNALRLLRNRELWSYFLGPLLISLFLFFLSLIYLLTQIDKFLNNYLVGWAEWLLSAVWWSTAIAAGSVLFVVVSVLAIPIASPFNDSLCNAILSSGRNIEKNRQFSILLTHFPSVICNEFRKLRYIILFSLPFIVLTIIPLVNGLSPFAWVFFSLWILAFEYFDYPMCLKNEKSSQTLRVMRKNRAFSIGFGLAMLFVTIVPILNFFSVPIGVLAASFSYQEGYLRYE